MASPNSTFGLATRIATPTVDSQLVLGGDTKLISVWIAHYSPGKVADRMVLDSRSPEPDRAPDGGFKVVNLGVEVKSAAAIGGIVYLLERHSNAAFMLRLEPDKPWTGAVGDVDGQEGFPKLGETIVVGCVDHY